LLHCCIASNAATALQEVPKMTDALDDDCEVIRGSGNVFRDFGHPDADREQHRAILAAEIIGLLDDRQLSNREAETLSGVAAADFSLIRRVNLRRFTIERLSTILRQLGREVETIRD
jgi:predicted XRE-type DNA-binding protein